MFVHPDKGRLGGQVTRRTDKTMCPQILEAFGTAPLLNIGIAGIGRLLDVGDQATYQMIRRRF